MGAIFHKSLPLYKALAKELERSKGKNIRPARIDEKIKANRSFANNAMNRMAEKGLAKKINRVKYEATQLEWEKWYEALTGRNPNEVILSETKHQRVHALSNKIITYGGYLRALRCPHCQALVEVPDGRSE